MTQHPGYALVTGASNGLGADMARLLAELGIPLVITARSAGALEELADGVRRQRGVDVRVIPMDLGEPGAGDVLADELEALGLPVEILVNNAGIGQFGPYLELDPETERSMLRLNMESLTLLTRRILPGMVERERGRILNVASVASFFPGPLMATYYATKAYVLSYSEALVEELRGTGVTVTCLCPGPTRTGFQDRASFDISRIPPLGVMDSLPVARAGIEGMYRGRRLVVPGFTNKLSILLPRFLPRALLPKLVEFAQARRKPGN